MTKSHGTGIEWTHGNGYRGETWNPTTGCSRVSDGCDHCYAEELSLRFGWSQKPWLPENAEENVVLHPERLSKPSRWREPRMIFVNSMSDLFHPKVPGQFINDVWMEMFNNPRHTFMILTKRPKRLRDWTRRAAAAKGWPEDEIWPDWMWVGTSIESREHVDRADLLREVPAAVRFISAEPLLGPLVPPWSPMNISDPRWSWGGDDGYDRPGLGLSGIHWLICGGESGRQARPMDLQWARDLLYACVTSETAYFMKQTGGLRPGTKLEDLPEDLRIREYPKTSSPLPASLF